MAMTSSYDPEILAFLSDQTQRPSGKKSYNPYFRSRIPRSGPSRVRTKAAPSSAVPSISPPALPADPLYFLHVLTGHEQMRAEQLRRYSAVTVAWVPVDADNEPCLPGTVILAIPDSAYFTVADQIRAMHWGQLEQQPADPSIVTAFLPYIPVNDTHPALGAFGPDHPVLQTAQAVLAAQGWHGQLMADGWAVYDAAGQPVRTAAAFDAFWNDLIQTWSQKQPLTDLVNRHSVLMQNIAYPLTLVNTRTKDWVIQWMNQVGYVPQSEHAGMRLRPGTTAVWGVLVQTDPLLFSLRHPLLAPHRLRYRLGSTYQDTIRVPGQWGLVLTDFLSEIVRRHVRQSAQSLGWHERWTAVSPTDPHHLLTALLKPQQLAFDTVTRRVRVDGIPTDRLVWVPKALEWLAGDDWVIE